MRITLTDRRPVEESGEGEQRQDKLHFEGGIRSFVEFLMEKRGRTPLFDTVVYLSQQEGDSSAEIALQYNDGFDTNVISFANNMHTVDGGTHESAFKTALTRVINAYGRKFKYLKDNDSNLKGDDVQEGLVAVVSVKLTDAQFESQTKAKLGNTAMGTLVNQMMTDKLMTFLEENPSVAKAILDKAMAASTAREAAQKARDLQRNRSGLSKVRMPEKLADCISNNPEETEIFIVEGDSAGGSAIRGAGFPHPGHPPSVGEDAQRRKGAH